MAYQPPPTPPQIYKDPNATLDYGFDLSPSPSPIQPVPWLESGETVTSLTVTPDSGITVDSSAVIANSSGTPASLLVAWISGGSLGTVYNVKFEFTTSLGRTDNRTMQISVIQR